jgi:hypothetical protein
MTLMRENISIKESHIVRIVIERGRGNPTGKRIIIFFNPNREKICKTTYERRSLHDWRGRDPGCPVAKTYCLSIFRLKSFYTRKTISDITNNQAGGHSFPNDYRFAMTLYPSFGISSEHDAERHTHW